MIMSLLSTANFQIPVTPMFLMVIFCILAAASIIHAVVLRYHWRNYGNGALELVMINLIYLVGLGILLGGMAIFLFAYSISK